MKFNFIRTGIFLSVAALAFLIDHLFGSFLSVGSTFMLGLVGAVTGQEGASALGDDNLNLGPCNVYFGKFNTPNLAGTVATTSGSDAVTGTGTAFNTDFAEGDWILIAGITAPQQIKTITSATAIVLMANVSNTLASATYKKAVCTNLGGVDKVTLKYAVKKADLKEAQNGESPADKAVTGYDSSVEFSMTRATIARLAKTTQGFKIVRDSTTKLIKGWAWTLPIGETDSEIADELRLVRLKKGVESNVALDTIILPKAAPTADSEAVYDASSQRMSKTMFTGYVDFNTLVNGAPTIMYAGDITP